MKAMKIEDVMTRRVVAARADTDLSHVARLMWDNDCGSVPVVDAEDKVVGILTDRDLHEAPTARPCARCAPRAA
jgi:CBS domain-containing protein